MRFAAALLIALLLLPAQAAAPAKKPPPPLDTLFAQLHDAQSPEEAKPVESQILAIFLQSGSPSIDLLMARAATAQAAGDKDTAGKLYKAVTAIDPKYAEGWHQRALMQAEAGDDGAAMISLQRAVQLNPKHFVAMEQLGEMLEDYGDKAGALAMYRRAIKLDPQYEGLRRHIDGLTRDVEGQGI